MITIEINRPSKYLDIRAIKEKFRNRTPPAIPIHGTPIRHDGMAGPQFMDKIVYARWIENVVKPQWPKGVLCTFDRIVEEDNKIPHPLFRVTDVNEIHTMSPIASVTQQPRCIVVEAAGFKGSNVTTFPPGILRKLTVRELELVHLRDKAKPDDQGSPPAANESYAG